MRINDLAAWITAELTALDHDEIVSVTNLRQARDDHNMVKVTYATEATTVIMAREARGPGVPRHEPFYLPKEAY